MIINTKNTEVLYLSRNPSQCVLQISGNTLQQVEKFKYVGVVFTSDRKQNKEVDTLISKSNAVLHEQDPASILLRESITLVCHFFHELLILLL